MASNRIVRGYGIYEQLKEHKPAAIVAFDGDGEETRINVPDVRNKHSRVMVTLREIAWVRCDLLDKKGGLLYRHHRCADDRDAPAGELEDMPTSRHAAELAGMVNIMLRAQEAVLVRHTQATQTILDAQMRLVDSAMRRLELQEAQIEHAMRLNHQLSSDLVNAQLAQLQLAPGPAVDDEGSQRPSSDRAIDALVPHMIRAALTPQQPQQSQQPQQARPATKKNGASPKTPTPTEPPARASSAPND